VGHLALSGNNHFCYIDIAEDRFERQKHVEVSIYKFKLTKQFPNTPEVVKKNVKTFHNTIEALKCLAKASKCF